MVGEELVRSWVRAGMGFVRSLYCVGVELVSGWCGVVEESVLRKTFFFC